MKKIKIGIILFVLIVISGCTNNITGETVKDFNKITIFKSSSCGCCTGYTIELKKQGFDVKVVETNDMNHIKEKYNIPSNVQSCHTVIMGDYFIEGHVPFEAINKLFEEKPDIDGIALSGMPSGSPGMPGIKNEKWVIYAISNGEATEFMVV